MARRKNYVWFTATTRWGTVRIGLPHSTYRRATARGRDDKLFPDGAGARDFVCIRVKRRLNSAGARVQFVHWSDLRISDVALGIEAAEQESVRLVPAHLLYQEQVQAIVDTCEPPSDQQWAEAAELFPELFSAASTTKAVADADFICGCVPFPVTTS